MFKQNIVDYGQHFLIDKTVIKKWLLAADFKTDDYVVEIGPGKAEYCS